MGRRQFSYKQLPSRFLLGLAILCITYKSLRSSVIMTKNMDMNADTDTDTDVNAITSSSHTVDVAVDGDGDGDGDAITEQDNASASSSSSSLAVTPVEANDRNATLENNNIDNNSTTASEAVVSRPIQIGTTQSNNDNNNKISDTNMEPQQDTSSSSQSNKVTKTTTTTTTVSNPAVAATTPTTNTTTTTTTTTTTYIHWTFPTANHTLTDSKRGIILLSMGPDAAKSYLVERIHISIRRRGQFFGPVIVLTDAPSNRYDDVTAVDPNFYVLHPKDKDWNWNLKKDMAYKRFKSFALEYLSSSSSSSNGSTIHHRYDEQWKSIEVLYYLDIDVVVGRPLQGWFDHVETNYLYHGGTDNGSGVDIPRIVFFEGNFRNWPIQGGQFILHRNLSQPCLERWRYHMDANPMEDKDQVSLGILAKEQEELQKRNPKQKVMCEIRVMPQRPFLTFLSKNAMTKIMNTPPTNVTVNTTTYGDAGGGGSGEDKRYPTLMHIKNTQHAAKIPDAKQREFYRDLLDLTPEQAKVMGKVRIRPNRTWSAELLSQKQQQQQQQVERE